MTHRRSILAVAVVLLATGLAGAQDLEGILTKIYEARGGLEKIKSVESARMSGMFVIPGMMEAPFTMEWKRPDKIRMEFETAEGNGVQASDGETAWAMMPGMPGPMELPDEQADGIRRQADLIDGPLVDWKDKGNSVEYLGEGELDGAAVYKVKLVRPDETEMTIFLDGDFLAIRQSGMVKVQGAETEADTFIGDYKEVDGLVMAHSIKTELIDMGMTQELKVDSVELNVEIADNRFVMPGAEDEEAEPEPDDDPGHGHEGDHEHGDHDKDDD